MCHFKTTTVLEIVRVLDRIKTARDKYIYKIPRSRSQYEIQNIALCGTALLLQRTQCE